MRIGSLLVLGATVLLAVTGTAIAADNTAPLANAGVDQTVPVNSTVYLDANGSVDPDGEIAGVEWAIETPSGGTLSPDCADCRRTEFDATALGQYTVTLTVTDDDGATRSDTLYVTTTTETGPDVSIAGPTSTAPGSSATFTANVSAENATLETLTWLVNGTVAERDSLEGASASRSFTHSFNSTAPVRAVVYDTLGERGSATHRVSVVSSSGGGGFSSGCTPSENDQLCNNDGADKRYTVDGDTYIVDTNNQEGIQTYRNGNLITIENPTESDIISERGNGDYIVDGTLSDVDYTNVDTTQATVTLYSGSNNALGDSGSSNDLADSAFDVVGVDLDGADADTVESASGMGVNDDGSVSYSGITVGGVDDGDSSSDDGDSTDSGDSGSGDSGSGDSDSGGGGGILGGDGGPGGII